MNYAGLHKEYFFGLLFLPLLERLSPFYLLSSTTCFLPSVTCSTSYFQSTMFSFQGTDLWFRLKPDTNAQSLKCLYPLSNVTILFALVGPSGLEPPTSRLSVARSSQLSYGPIMVEIIGLEPMTPCLQSRCSPSWAIPPYPHGVYPLN